MYIIKFTILSLSFAIFFYVMFNVCFVFPEAEIMILDLDFIMLEVVVHTVPV